MKIVKNMYLLNVIINQNIICSKELPILISKGKFIRNFSISPVLSLLNNDGDEDMNDLVDNPQSNSESEDETEPST
jgi:hypothetical protein